MLKPKHTSRLELNRIIHKILLTNDFVSLPGLGSFVRKYEPAKLSSDGKTLLPPSEKIFFDTSRTFNDEAIENFLVENKGISKSEAETEVKIFCEKISDDLGKGVEIDFYNIGSLKKDSDGNFTLSESDSIISSTFGLESIDIPEKKEHIISKPGEKETIIQKDIEPKKSEKTEKSIVAPVHADKKSKNTILVPLVSILAVASIAIVLIFIPELRFWEQTDILTENKEIKPIQNSAELVNNVQNQAGIDTHVDSSKTFEPTDSSQIIISDASEVSEVSKPTTHEHTLVPIDKKSALFYQEKNNNQNNVYYIVVGSFSQKVNAEKLVKKLEVDGYKPSIIPVNNIYRVAIYSFSNRERALRELERVRRLNLTSQAWLLTLKVD